MEYHLLFRSQHMLIENESRALLVDTGSPQSIHKDGEITIDGTIFHVDKQLMTVDPAYLSKKVGEEISGLIGMDILSNYEVWFDHKTGMMLLTDDDAFSNWPKGGSLMGVPTLEMDVEGRKATMILDSGAQYSYISGRYIASQLKPIATVTDFAPILGLDSFNVPLFELGISVSKSNPQLQDTYKLAFGEMPSQLSMVLERFNIDGIVGVNFFKTFRMVLSYGRFLLPPQGI